MQSIAGLFRPISQAWALAGRPGSMMSLAILAIFQIGYLIMFDQIVSASEYTAFLSFSIGAELTNIVMLGVLVFMLGQRLFTGEGHDAPRSIAAWAGLFALYIVVRALLSAIVPLLIINFDLPGGAATLSAVISIVPQILIFPLMVRLMALGAPFAEPKLGAVWTRLWSGDWAYLVCYLLVLLLPSLAFDVVRSLLVTQVTRIWFLPQGLVLGIEAWAGLLIAAAAARAFTPSAAAEAEVFR